MDSPECYRLQLGDGQKWEIIATQSARTWVGRLASIMRLPRSEPDSSPRLFFTRKNMERDWLPNPVSRLSSGFAWDLPVDGWRVHDLRSMHVWIHDEVPHILSEIGDEGDHDLDIVRMWLSLAPVYHRTLWLGGLPLHAALVERNGTGVLLSAPGGTGKSTCCERIPYPWKALCDDLSLAIRDEQDQYRVHPFPTWSNYLWKRRDITWDVQQHIPLSAMFFLEQSETDGVERIGSGQASVLITESAQQICQAAWTNLLPDEYRGFTDKIFQNACTMAGRIPVFKLRVSLDGKFWEEMEKVLV